MISCTNRDDLHKLFPLPLTSAQTSGVQDGVIVRFRTFYLKIYDDRYEYAYNIQGYRYNETNPVFEEKVRISKFKRFASQFIHEDYLHGYHKHPCWNHHHHHHKMREC